MPEVHKSYSSWNNPGRDFGGTLRDGMASKEAGTVKDGDYMPVTNLKFLLKMPYEYDRARIGERKFDRRQNPDGILGGFVENGIIVPDSVELGVSCAIMNEATIGEGTIIKGRSVVGGKSRVGKNVFIENSDIDGSSVVGDDSKIINSSLRNRLTIGKSVELRTVNIRGFLVEILEGVKLNNLDITKNETLSKDTSGSFKFKGVGRPLAFR